MWRAEWMGRGVPGGRGVAGGRGGAARAALAKVTCSKLFAGIFPRRGRVDKRMRMAREKPAQVSVPQAPSSSRRRRGRETCAVAMGGRPRGHLHCEHRAGATLRGPHNCLVLQEHGPLALARTPGLAAARTGILP